MFSFTCGVLPNRLYSDNAAQIKLRNTCISFFGGIGGMAVGHQSSWSLWSDDDTTDRIFQFTMLEGPYLIFITARCLGNKSYLWNVNGDVYDEPKNHDKMR